MDQAPSRRQEIQAAALVALGAEQGARVVWSRSLMPAISNEEVLARAIAAKGLSPRLLILNISPQTELERSDGHWAAAMAGSLGHQQGDRSLKGMEQAFLANVAPMQQAVQTRVKGWASWKVVLTWAAARDCLDKLLPMSLGTLRALVWEALAVGCSSSVVGAIIDSVLARHRFFELQPPLEAQGDYTRFTSTLGRFQGRQAELRYPVHKDVVAKMLRHRAVNLAGWRDRLAAVIATLCCLRPSEGARAQVCDFFPDFDKESGFPGWKGTAALNVRLRKNDQQRRGHWPRMGRSRDPDLDAVYQMKAWMRRAGLVVQTGCTRRTDPQGVCRACAPLFPLSVHRSQSTFILSRQPSPSAFSAMIVRGLKSVGMDTRLFSGKSARMGGLSTAIEASVPEWILWMQSGHAQDKAARAYVALRSPVLLFRTWEAFDL